MTDRRERGVALLTVLLLVTVMAALSVAVLDDIRFGLRRTANAETIGQARWYALGAEALARARIARTGQGPSPAATPGLGQVMRSTIDGGSIETRLTDGASCFNLNSVVQGQDGIFTRREEGVRQFRALAAALGFGAPQAERMASALVDWIDSDDLVEPGGAEDLAYLPAYRTGATLLAEASELRAIRGFEGEAYRRLRPYLCALPTSDLSPINVNTLAPEQAVLLTMLTNGALDEGQARRLIAERPAQGWASLDRFWEEVARLDVTPDEPVREQAVVHSRFFTLEAKVDYAGAEVVSSALLERADDGRVVVAARRWGRAE